MALFFITSILLLAHTVRAFPLSIRSIPGAKAHLTYHASKTSLWSSTTTSTTFQPSEKLSPFLTSIQRPRGLSVGVEYTSSDSDVSVLSMQLRKLNARAIYTSNLDAVSVFMKEQQSSLGNFPGPVPVVYNGKEWRDGIDCNSDLIVLGYGDLSDDDKANAISSDVGVIWEVDKANQISDAMEKNMGSIFILSNNFLFNGDEGNDIDMEKLDQQLSTIPESAILIAQLPSMLQQNNEVSLGKSLSSFKQIKSLVFKDCCVNDEEDVKYAQFVIDGISKKSSSTFSMTGLTGSTNGHFGVSSHSGEVKWRRGNA